MGHPAVAQITLAVTGATLNADAAPEREQEGEMPAVPGARPGRDVSRGRHALLGEHRNSVMDINILMQHSF